MSGCSFLKDELFEFDKHPIKSSAKQIYFIKFSKKKKIIYFFQENHKLKDELPTVIKVTLT